MVTNIVQILLVDLILFRMTSTIKYYKCEEIFMDLPLWKSVPETERREIFSDVVHNLAKKEKVHNDICFGQNWVFQRLFVFCVARASKDRYFLKELYTSISTLAQKLVLRPP